MDRAHLCDILAKECRDIHQTVNRLQREVRVDHLLAPLSAGPAEQNEIMIRKLRVDLRNYENGIELLRKVDAVKAVKSGPTSS